jgi:hypothetical protein
VRENEAEGSRAGDKRSKEEEEECGGKRRAPCGLRESDLLCSWGRRDTEQEENGAFEFTFTTLV